MNFHYFLSVYFYWKYLLQDTVFHGVHKDDLKIALKFNCDYRRYARKRDGGIYENSQHPMFYKTFSDLLNNTTHAITDINVLVVKILTDAPKTQCDYYVQYIVKFWFISLIKKQDFNS